MSVVDESILNGQSVVSQAQARQYLGRRNQGRLTAAEIAEVVDACWSIGGELRIRPDMAFAQMMHETAFFTFPNQVKIGQKNPAGLGATNNGAQGLVFATWRDGIVAYYVHLVAWLGGPAIVPEIGARYSTAIDPRIPIVEDVRATKGAATTWRSLGGRWAVPGTEYGEALQRHWDALRQEVLLGGNMAKIVFSAGHWNTDGGNALEKTQTILHMRAAAAACRARGHDVRCIQPEVGNPEFAGGLWDVAHTVVRFAQDDGWVPDYFIELHTEGVDNPQVRGVFVIYPDMEGDVDTDVRDHLGGDIARRIAAATGLPVRGDGLMPETKTGVGLSGFRLGIFGQSTAIKATTTRCIIEVGSHSSPKDLEIMGQDGFFERAAGALADAIDSDQGVIVNQPGPSKRVPGRFGDDDGPNDTITSWKPNDFTVDGRFLEFWRSVPNGLMVFGLPITGTRQEQLNDGQDHLVQYFERARFELHPNNSQPFDVLLGQLGREVLQI
ncbi:MAG: glucosaminidase domain-containing protein [Thermomicrobiales bacterium]